MMSEIDISPTEWKCLTLEPIQVHTDPVNSSSSRSGELARLTGVSVATLRHYENLGILALLKSRGYNDHTNPSKARVDARSGTEALNSFTLGAHHRGHDYQQVL